MDRAILTAAMMVLKDKEVSKMVSSRNGRVDGMGIAHLKSGWQTAGEIRQVR
jgi:hypothetical protein